MEKVKFKFDNGEITYALRMRLGQIGETDFEERDIPGQTRFLVYFDRGTEKEERWWIPETSIVPVVPMLKYEEIYITVDGRENGKKSIDISEDANKAWDLSEILCVILEELTPAQQLEVKDFVKKMTGRQI